MEAFSLPEAARKLPSEVRRGGCGIKKENPIRTRADGVVPREWFRLRNQPAVTIEGGFASFFLDCSGTPPNLGGEFFVCKPLNPVVEWRAIRVFSHSLFLERWIQCKIALETR